jgi:tyrosyl-tRNA synthetase
MTSPLLTLPSGAKLGKSEVGTHTWLDPRRTSPYQFFQYWMQSEDEHVGRYLRFFTFLDREQITALDEATADRPERREAQRTLAFEVTSFVHGRVAAEQTRKASDVLFSAAIASLDEATLVDVMAEAPSTDRPRADLDGDISLVDVLVETGLCASKSDARRQLAQKAVYINNVQVTDPERRLTRDDLLHDQYVVLRRGRKEQHLLAFHASM